MNKMELNSYNESSCRTCLGECNKLTSIYDNNSADLTFANMIMSFTSVLLEENDGLYGYICENCVTQVSNAYKFMKRCEEVDLTLKLFLNSCKTTLTAELEMESDIIARDKQEDVNISEMVSSTNLDELLEIDDDCDVVSNVKNRKLFVCEICQKSYVQHTGLVWHMRLHTGERPFVCNQCGRGFIRSDDLLRHRRIHTGERPFVCQICNRGFKQKFHLSEHERSHNGKRELKCKECGKCFVRHGVLRTHMRTHTGVKAYSCKLCSKSFVGSDTLTKHMRTHTGEKPYNCRNELTSSEDEITTVSKLTKKRPSNGRLSDVAKKLRIKGNVTGEDCNCSRFCCFNNINKVERDQLINGFNCFETRNEQDGYLASLISVLPVQRRRNRKMPEEAVFHDRSYSYNVCIIRDEQATYIQVCYKAFIALHGITPRRAQTIKAALVSTGKPPIDNRGKHTNRPRKLSNDTMNCITTFIGSLKGPKAHYSLAKLDKVYLPEDLNIRKLHTMYTEKHSNNPVSYEKFRLIFVTKFNISFGYPKTDTGSTCDEQKAQEMAILSDKTIYLSNVKK